MTEPQDPICPLCNCKLGETIAAPERMFGLGGSFRYGTCPQCGMLCQIQPPADVSLYYPANYYSMVNNDVAVRQTFTLRRWVARHRNDAQIFGKPLWALPIAKSFPSEFVRSVTRFLKHASKQKGKQLRILDVGSGGGQLLQLFASLGFRCLEGVDPYIASPEITRGPVRIRRIEHTALRDETFDLVLLNHSLEHMHHQLEAVTVLGDLLTDVGVARIEVPVADCDAFAEYGADWIELDPPRHMFLHTRKSLRQVAESAGLDVIEIEEVGGVFEFWGSELYRRGYTWFDAEKSRLRTPEESFTEAERIDFKRRSDQANAAARGGRIAIYLRRKP